MQQGRAMLLYNNETWLIERERNQHATYFYPFCSLNVELCFGHFKLNNEEGYIEIADFFLEIFALLPHFERHCYLDRLAMSVTQGGRRIAGGMERWWWRGQIRFARCDENRGMLLIMEKYPQPRRGAEEEEGWLASVVDTPFVFFGAVVANGYCGYCVHPRSLYLLLFLRFVMQISARDLFSRSFSLFR